MDLALVIQTALNGLANGALYAVIAAGFVLVYRATSVVNFAIAEFILIGAYLTYTMSLFFPLLLAILLALPLAFVFGVLVERGFVRPLLGRNVVAVIMATIGLAATLDGATLILWGPDQKAMGAADVSQLPKEMPSLAFSLGGVFLSSKAVWSLILALPLAILLVLALKYSRYGVLLRAVSESETAALAMGINAPRVVAVAWGISAVTATIGGAFLAGAAGGGWPRPSPDSAWADRLPGGHPGGLRFGAGRGGSGPADWPDRGLLATLPRVPAARHHPGHPLPDCALGVAVPPLWLVWSTPHRAGVKGGHPPIQGASEWPKLTLRT